MEWNEREQATAVLTQGIQLILGTTEMGLLARGCRALARRHWTGGRANPLDAVLRWEQTSHSQGETLVKNKGN